MPQRCEPYITADDMLMRERALDAIKGIQVLMKLTGADDCLVGIEDNKPEAIKAMEDALHQVHGEHHIVIVTIPTKYPSGGEKQLIQILTGKEVPSGGIPADIGIVCQNVGTAAAIYKAVAIRRTADFTCDYYYRRRRETTTECGSIDWYTG